MSLKQLFVAVAAAFLILGNVIAIAGQTVDVAGAIACVKRQVDSSWPLAGRL